MNNRRKKKFSLSKATNERRPPPKGGIEYIFYDGFGIVCGGTRFKISEQAFSLCKLMDGKTTNEELIQEFANRYGLYLNKRNLYRFIHKLKKYNLLADNVGDNLLSKLSRPYRKKQLKRFDRLKIKQPTYAGLLYNCEPKKLKKDLEICFSSVDRQTLNVHRERKGKLKGIIVPHSNIELSGSCAAWGYEALAQAPKPDTIVILAPNHYTNYPFSVLSKDFLMPMGLVRTDKDFCRALAKRCRFKILHGIASFIKEYSIEIQLSFLQYIYKQNMEKIKIVPILCAEKPYSMSEFHICQKDFLQALRSTIIESGKNIIFVATGDLVHSERWKPGPAFHKKNKDIIHLLKKGNAYTLRHRLTSAKYRICGRNVFYTFLKLLEPTRGRMLNYSWTSHPNISNKNRTHNYIYLYDIGYVSMLFY